MFYRIKDNRAGLFASVLAFWLLAGGIPSLQATEHKPRFSFKENQKSVFRGKTHNVIHICDNDKVIAVVFPAYSPNCVATVRNVVLRPESGYGIEWWDLMWKTGCWFPDPAKVTIDDSNPKALKMTFTGKDKTRKGGFEVRAQAILTYDVKINSYVYEISIEKIPPKVESYESLVGSWQSVVDRTQYGTRDEGCYCNVDCGRFGTRMGSKKYCVYENRAGGMTKVPHHSLLAPDKYNIRLKKGGAKMGMLGNPKGVLIVEFLGETATNTRLGLCNAGFDVWFVWALQPGRNRPRAKFKIYSYDTKRGEEFFKKAKISPFTDEELKIFSLPRYRSDGHPLSDFESGIDPKVNDRGAYWAPFGDMIRTEWCRSAGHSGTGSLKTQTDTPVQCYWGHGPQSGSTTVPKDSTAVASVWIKTENLEGKGAYFTVQYRSGRKKGRVESRKLTGTNDWTKVSVKIPAGSTWFRFTKLVHEGKGTSYFDDVDYRIIKK